MNPVKVAVIGVGYLGSHHARKYSTMPEAELVGVVDVDREKAKEVARECGTNAYSGIKAILNEVEAVSVAVPTSSHFSVVEELLEKKINVLVEKPISLKVEEAKRLINLAREKNVILMVGHLERFNPVFDVLDDRVSEPGFIESHRLSQFKERAVDVDVVLDLMIHDLDIILHLSKSKILGIDAVGVPVLSKNVDIANVRLRFENGCVANITASRVSREEMRKTRIFQPDSYISVDYLNQELFLYRRDDEKGSGDFPSIVAERIAPGNCDILTLELKSFLNSVMGNETLKLPPEDALEALRVALEIKKKIT